jgi:cell division control protein 6
MSNIFKNENLFDRNFTPDVMYYREKELCLLSQLFLELLINPNNISRKILVTGKPRTGKTISIRFFANFLVREARRRRVVIKNVYIDCKYHNTIDKVLSEIRNQLNAKDEKQFIKRISDNLRYRNIYPKPNPHILLILDDLDCLDDDPEHLLKLISVEYENSAIKGKKISIISIASSLDFLKSSVGNNVAELRKNLIEFTQFSREQVFDILNYRASLGMYVDAYTSEIIEMITELTLRTGEVSDGLDLLWEAGKVAEEKNLRQITPECVRLGQDRILRR